MKNFSTTLLVAGAVAMAAVVMPNPVVLEAKPVWYKLPEDTVELKPGPNVETVRNNCTACHSADYIKTQPQGPKFKKDFWQAEVTKMIKVFGAPINEADVPKIVDYLTETY